MVKFLERRHPDDILLEAEEKMIKNRIGHRERTRSASAPAKHRPRSSKNILVEVYGSQMRLRELAGISRPNPRMLESCNRGI